MSIPEFGAYATSRIVFKRVVAQEQIEMELEPAPWLLAAYRRAGQFCRVRVRDGDGRDREGIFAMLSAPGEPSLRFLVRAPTPQRAAAADRLAELPVGTSLQISPPAGDGFPLERMRGRNVHFVATGTAIAPVRAAIEVVLRNRSEYGALSLDHGLRGGRYLAIARDIDRWTALGVAVRLHYSSPDREGSVRGVLVQDAVLDHVTDLQRAAFVAVGQPAMLRELCKRITERGGDPELVFHNY